MGLQTLFLVLRKFHRVFPMLVKGSRGWWVDVEFSGGGCGVVRMFDFVVFCLQ